MQTAFNYYPR